jgi:hypothetical protein
MNYLNTCRHFNFKVELLSAEYFVEKCHSKIGYNGLALGEGGDFYHKY